MIAYATAFIAVICYAALTVFAKKVQGDIPSYHFIALTTIILSALSLMAGKIFEKSFSITQISLLNWGWITLFSLVNLAGFTLLLKAVKEIPIFEYQIIAVLTPIIGGGMAFLLLSEPLSPKYFIGLIFIAIGLYIAIKP